MPQSIASDTDRAPKSTFEIYRAEGDTLLRLKQYNKAINRYKEALELQPNDCHCLVQRSKCYLAIANTKEALADAEAALAVNEKYYRGLFQKAEVLYFKGEFESALMFYHQGFQLRPELQVFRLGIQKSEEAIMNCVGDSNVVRLKSGGDLKFFYKADTDPAKPNYQPQKQKKQALQKLERLKPPINSMVVKKFLGSLYKDQEYLEHLIKYEAARIKIRRQSRNFVYYSQKDKNNRSFIAQVSAWHTHNSETVRELAINTLNYLDIRTEFWQQQKPMYSRDPNKIKEMEQEHKKILASKRQSNIIRQILILLEEIEAHQASQDHFKALSCVERLRANIKRWGHDSVPNYYELQANLASFAGTAQLELEEFELAEKEHLMDLQLGQDHDLPDVVSRAMDNVGRVYARMGEFNKAIEIWEKKLPETRSELESAWLNHEIGRCYLELGNGEKALEHGLEALKAAEMVEDNPWVLNATVLVAQAYIGLKEADKGQEYFEKGIKVAKELHNSDAVAAIEYAMENELSRENDSYAFSNDEFELSSEALEPMFDRPRRQSTAIPFRPRT